MRIRFILFLLIFSLLIPLVANAHRIRIFAYVDNDTIIGETAFSGGKVPRNTKIEILDSTAGKMLGSVLTDGEGNFSLPVPPELKSTPFDLLVVINVGDGHRAEWLIKSEEFLPGTDGLSSKRVVKPPEGVTFVQVVAGLGCVFGLALVVVIMRKIKKRGKA